MFLKIHSGSLQTIFITVGNSENKVPPLARSGSRQLQSNHPFEVLKSEINRYLSECGGKKSDEETSDSKYHKTNSSNTTSGDDRDSNWRKYDNNDQKNNREGERFSGNYGGSNVNRGDTWSNHDTATDSNSGSWTTPRTPYGALASDMGFSNRSSYGDYNYGQPPTDYARDKNRDYGRNGDGMNDRRRDYDGFGYSPNYNMRSKRSQDDTECVTQCVFGYLEVLDDNRSPSESAIIKWLQDHVPNDGTRVRALRETRRCFAKLAASDNEDGCDFSKAISNCLNLQIDK